MERLYRGFDIITNPVHTSNQQRPKTGKAENFAASDRIRDQLQELGTTLIDQSDGTTRWHS
ncbi:hypothetical protein PN465_10435 [Nodularia spumigena CS-584]|jgi:cysteinyl-tRNA synthetase|uniref:Cysteine--tRNA ligase n=2 Tax=Nodularia spumigena TaxID=70799 RepID=A0A2S0Q949_NODSP|nr:hypothetical protein [Nodularia spumigena]AHJ29609.1 hypothetical protein NSP_32840 [Nodularia spumigena CCY9414]AVZ31205.1 cysteine--tRNA ligase [Nodularia spumigena UHCC 0039]EAW43757.1 hypothetical protein N9414_10842 [Nodularia spumigena CCY9414]MDB9382637.1 hypothetical protein [Nodularia spumigena CS-584]MEA5527692.1 hypothetical protein [Nodularia spumigena UHCC 0143]